MSRVFLQVVFFFTQCLLIRKASNTNHDLSLISIFERMFLSQFVARIVFAMVFFFLLFYHLFFNRDIQRKKLLHSLLLVFEQKVFEKLHVPCFSTISLRT
jgi:hypothetical protein